MLTQQNSTDKSKKNDLWTQNSSKYWAMFIALGSFLGMIWLFSKMKFHQESEIQHFSKLRIVGIELLTTYSLPFELVGVFLLIALVGATYIAKNHE